MTAQRPSSPLNVPAASTTPFRNRGMGIAVTSAAIPAVVLSSVALAAPAAAAPAPGQVSYQPLKTVPAASGSASAFIPASLVAAQVPRIVPMRSTPSTYVVRPGDTVSGIAARHGVDMHAVLKANGLKTTSIIHPGQKLKLSGATAQAAPARKAAPAPQSATYTVKAGDTLGAISARHGVSLSSVLKANGLSMASVIHPGQKIRISGSAAAPTPAPKAAAPKPAAPSSGATYTVKAGDTLGAIAAKHGISLSALLSANKLSATTIIFPGKKLTIPGGSKTSSGEKPADLVPSTFLHYTYPDAVVAEANKNKHTLNNLPAPSQAQMKAIVADTARKMGVDPSLALAFSYQESGFNQRAVSPANAIGAMQVIPMSGEWASDLVGRKLNLLDPYDNATAGVAIIKALIRSSPNLDIAIASYYQGQYSVKTHGMFADTKNYVAAIKAHQKNFR